MRPAASSSVAIAANYMIKQCGGLTIGTPTSPAKVQALQNLAAAEYDYLAFHRQVCKNLEKTHPGHH